MTCTCVDRSIVLDEYTLVHTTFTYETYSMYIPQDLTQLNIVSSILQV